MKTFVKIYKAVLLWVAVASHIIFLLGLESMIEEKRIVLIMVWVVMNFVFCWLIKTLFTIRELYKLSGTYYVEKALKP